MSKRSSLPVLDEYYGLLHVDKNVDEDGLKKAYKKASLKNHPDKGGDVESFNRMKRAYDVLSDPSARKRYDVMGIDLGDEEGGGDPADEIYAAGKPIFQEIGQVCVKTAIGGAFIVLACRWRWARALLWLACAALLVMVQAKGRQRALFGALLLGVNLVILAGTYVSLIARALEAFVWFCVLGFVDAYLAALSGKDDGPTLPSRKELAIKVAVSGALAWWHRARIWRYFGALVLELFFILVTHLFFSLAGALAKEIVEQKLGKYAGILRPIIADAERRCSLAEAQLLGTQQRLDKLQKAQK